MPRLLHESLLYILEEHYRVLLWFVINTQDLIVKYNFVGWAETNVYVHPTMLHKRLLQNLKLFSCKHYLITNFFFFYLITNRLFFFICNKLLIVACYSKPCSDHGGLCILLFLFADSVILLLRINMSGFQVNHLHFPYSD